MLLRSKSQPHNTRLDPRQADEGTVSTYALLTPAGNNAVEMQTTATWEPRTSSFIIHSPTTLSQKYWITNSAVHAQWCVVFAQLLMDGKNHGIHGFLVR
jgi:acyl-CoA oxidase